MPIRKGYEIEDMMLVKLQYIIKFVADMDRAVQFYRDTLGFSLRYQSPDWSEFATGETLLALHLASSANPAGSAQLGLHVSDMQAFYKDMTAKGVRFTKPPMMEHGALSARFLDVDGNGCTVTEEK